MAAVKEKQNQTLVKGSRQILFSITAVEERAVLNSEYSKDSWGFIAHEQSEEVSGSELTGRRHQG